MLWSRLSEKEEMLLCAREERISVVMESVWFYTGLCLGETIAEYTKVPH
jgi:hypothetical protein